MIRSMFTELQDIIRVIGDQKGVLKERYNKRQHCLTRILLDSKTTSA